MSAAVVLVDSGPLVALFDPSSRARPACRATLDVLGRAELVTNLAVLTEAASLLDFSIDARRALFAFVASGALAVDPAGASDVPRAGELMDKYADVPMDFVDATLVAQAERLGTTGIFTLDEDFDAYRVGRKSFRRVPE